MFKDFYKDFFLKYPIHIKGSKLIPNALLNLIKLNPNSIEYYNNNKVLKSIYSNINPVGSENHYPINDQIIDNNQKINDSLKNLIYCLDNFWFCYSIIDDVKPDEFHEAQTFYSIKGITISQTRYFDKCTKDKKFNNKIIPNETCKEIFKLDPQNNKEAKPDKVFNGYLF